MHRNPITSVALHSSRLVDRVYITVHHQGVNDAVAKLIAPPLWDGAARPAAPDTILYTCPDNFNLIEGLSGMMTTYDDLLGVPKIFFVLTLNEGFFLGNG